MKIIVSECGTIVLDHRTPVSDLVAVGKYTHVDSQIFKRRFPSFGSGIQELAPKIGTVREPGVSDYEVERELLALGHRLGTIQLLLTLAIVAPNVLIGTPILPLWSAERIAATLPFSRIPYANAGENYRQARLGFRGDAWPAGTRYLIY